MSQAELNEEIRRELLAVVVGVGCELLDCQFKGGVLRLVIDRPTGVTLEHCQEVSKQTSTLLDVEDFGSKRYTLEVTSPGLDRKFYSDNDFDRFTGRLVRITWKEPEMAHKKTLVGTLTAYSADSREVLLDAAEEDGVHKISLKDIQVARLEPEF